MGSLSIEPHLSIEQIKERLYSCKSGRHASYWQIILTLRSSPGKKAKEYAALLGQSERKLYRIRGLYNKESPAFTKRLLWGGRREPCCLMSVEQEKELLQNWTTATLAGEVLVAKQLREAVEKKIGHRVSDDYLWDLLKRHGWTKKALRPEHPKAADIKEKREAFKKKHLPSLVNKQPIPNR